MALTFWRDPEGNTHTSFSLCDTGQRERERERERERKQGGGRGKGRREERGGVVNSSLETGGRLTFSLHT